MQLHDTLKDAKATGFRPCKRCNPDGLSVDAENAALVAKACRLIEKSEEELTLNDLASAVECSPSHFHRMFKATTGLTPRDYADAHRATRIREGLMTSNSVTEAIYDAGFNSSGRFYEKCTDILGMTPTQYRSGGANEEIRFAVGECSLGALLVASSKKGIAAILLGGDPDRLVQELQDRFPKANLIGADREYEALVARVVGFIEDPEQGLDLPLDIRGTAFQQRVWRALKDIPVGRTISYAELAGRIGSPKAVRAVAGACAANNIAVAILVPSGRALRRLALRLRVGRGPQARADRKGGSTMNFAGVVRTSTAIRTAETRVAQYDWNALSKELSGYGCAVIKNLLSPEECRQIAGLYPEEGRFRSHIHMARHGFGKGEYRYFKYPLPDLIGGLRTALYTHLASIANDWNERMGIEQRFPERHAEFLKRCHDQGQTRPTPLLLQYVPGDFNCLHQDIYGELAFPLQVAKFCSGTRKRFHRRRVCLDRATAAHAEPGRGCAVTTGRRGSLCRPQPAAQRNEGQLSRQSPARRKPHPQRTAAHGWHHFPRREVARRTRPMSAFGT